MGTVGDWLTDKRFLVGLAVGWLVIPYASRQVAMMLQSRKTSAPAANGGV